MLGVQVHGFGFVFRGSVFRVRVSGFSGFEVSMFEVSGSGFRVQGFRRTGFHVPVSWFSEFGVSHSGFSAFRGSGFRVRGLGCRVSVLLGGFSFSVRGLRFRVFRFSRSGLGVSR